MQEAKGQVQVTSAGAGSVILSTKGGATVVTVMLAAPVTLFDAAAVAMAIVKIDVLFVAVCMAVEAAALAQVRPHDPEHV